MQKMLAILTVITAALLFSTEANSKEKVSGGADAVLSSAVPLENLKKHLCLILAKNCVGGNDSGQNRVERLNKEIDKGAAAYTPEELQQLIVQLNWIYYESDHFPAVGL